MHARLLFACVPPSANCRQRTTQVRDKLADLDVKIGLLENKIQLLDFGVGQAEKALP
jgi:hypothetical protein